MSHSFPFRVLAATLDWLRNAAADLNGSRHWPAEDLAVLRADQMETWNRQRMVPTASNLSGALVAWVSLLSFVDGVWITLWLLSILAIVAVDLMTGPGIRGYRPSRDEVDYYHRQSVAVCLAFGVVWGLLVTLFYRNAGTEGQFVITILVTAYLGTTPFLLAAIPASVYAFATPIAIQTLITFCLAGAREHSFELMLLAIYAVIFPLILRQHAISFAERSMALVKVDEQKHLIGLLLHDFEANSSEWLWHAGADLTIERVSEAFAKQAGIDSRDLTGRKLDAFLLEHMVANPAPDSDTERALEHLEAREPFRDLAVQLQFGGREHWWSVTGTPAYDRSGAFLGYRGIGREITDRKRSERELTYLAHHDTLTGAANRASFNNRLEKLREEIAEGRRCALILFDLDDFKAVNDTAGHAVGDEVLRTACRRIALSLPAGAFLARMGGDEFAVILDIRADMGAEEVKDLARRLVGEVNRPILLSEGAFRIGASAGIALMPDDGRDAAAVMQLADIALYNAKALGKDGVCMANAADGAAYSHRKLLELDLRRAVDEGSFTLAFQPVVDARTGKTMAFEALARWQHPMFGNISPGEFIPMAEHTGFIHQIGRWAITEACRCAVHWPPSIRVAVNISPRQFEREELASIVSDALRETGLPPDRLEIEITESTYLGGIDLVRRTVSRLHALGVTIAMDDFGTGYSSLSSLQDVPFDRLKIDQSLARQNSTGRRTLSILRSILAIGKALGLHVTAEGVETAEQAALLRGLGCDSLQGYFFGSPMPFEEIPSYLLSEAVRLDARADRPAAGGDGATAAA
jgi:diguanylate cyclase (GGDEF)-like protein/PAS domain S-box-containing protein